MSKSANQGAKEEDFAPSSPNENEFVSDSFQADEISQEDLKKEMQMLGVDDNKAETKTEKDEGRSTPGGGLLGSGSSVFFFLRNGILLIEGLEIGFALFS